MVGDDVASEVQGKRWLICVSLQGKAISLLHICRKRGKPMTAQFIGGAWRCQRCGSLCLVVVEGTGDDVGGYAYLDA